MPASAATKVGVYVDNANLYMNGGFGMRYDVLREFACRHSAEPVRLNVYVSFDADRADNDPAYRLKHDNFCNSLRDFGYKVIEKRVKWYTDDRGERYGKANADLDLAVDALLQSENIDRVLLATGDGDFVQVVRALQNRGCRVEVVAFENVSWDLRREADLFVSGYLIPNLLPLRDPARDPRDRPPPWGEVGSTVRGVCYHRPLGQPYGFFRFLKRAAGELWRTDPRLGDSAYQSVFCHDSQLPRELNPDDLPSREHIFEFELAEGEQGKGVQARNVRWVSPRRAVRRDAPRPAVVLEPADRPAADMPGMPESPPA